MIPASSTSTSTYMCTYACTYMCTDSRGRNETVKSWTGAFIGSGLIAIFLASLVAPTGGSASLVAGTAEGSVVNFPVEMLPAFLRTHQSEIVVSPDSTTLFAAITAYPNPRQPEAALVWACIGASRWLDLGSLDLLVRVANGMSLCKTRTKETIASDFREKQGARTENRSQIDPATDQKSPPRDRIRHILEVLGCLRADLGRMHEAETTLPSEPEYRLTPLALEVLKSLQQQAESGLGHRTQRLRDQRIAASLSPQAEHPGPETPSGTGSTRVPVLLPPDCCSSPLGREVTS